MSRLERPPQPHFLEHLVQRYREGRISVGDFQALQTWLDSDPEVPDGRWFKKFPNFILVGEGPTPKTFLTAAMIPYGVEVD